MVTDEMVEKATAAYMKDTGAERHQLDGWFGPAIRAALEAALSAQVQDVAGLESNPVTLRWWCQQLLDIIENHDISHDSCDEEIALINDIRSSVDPAAPAKQEGGNVTS